MENVKRINKLKLFDMIKHPELYAGLADGLIELPLPDKFKMKGKILHIPDTRQELAENICYGQRLYLSRNEINDFGIIIRISGGYFYPQLTGLKFNDKNICKILKYVLTCLAKDIYPVVLHIVKLMGELIENEQKLLHREPTKMELAAGIEKLDPYAELNVLDFLRDAMKVTVDEVLITPYNECLVRLMNAKAIQDYQERYMKLQSEEMELKTKKHV
jgi:hypothetical protein